MYIGSSFVGNTCTKPEIILFWHVHLPSHRPFNFFQALPIYRLLVVFLLPALAFISPIRITFLPSSNSFRHSFNSFRNFFQFSLSVSSHLQRHKHKKSILHYSNFAPYPHYPNKLPLIFSHTFPYFIRHNKYTSFSTSSSIFFST